MAGLYITLGHAESDRLDGVAAYLRFSNESERRFADGISYAWLSHDDVNRYAPATDPKTGVHVVVAGRLCWPSNTWQRAESLPFDGGTANRILLERYLNDGPKSVAPYNGAAFVVIWDPREQTCHFWTDQFGYHPAFVAGENPNQPTVITTFPDAISADPEIELEPDYVSMAEFLRAWRATPPHTYYRNVKHAGAATHWELGINGSVGRETYWSPFESDFFPSLNAAAEEFSMVLRTAVSERTAVAERPVFFVSGGADSRVMLYGADDPARVVGINVFERPTNESAVARALCDRAGAKYVPFQRDGDYYPRMQGENVRWSGGMWCTEDNHYLGVQDLVTDLNADLVMTACTTDWLFKGYGLEKTHKQLFGKNLPIKEFAEKRVDGFLPNYPLAAPSEFADEIDERMASCFDGVPSELKTDRCHLLAEDRRIRPACYTVSVSGQIMYRTYPYDTFLADSRVADCYSRIKAAWKLNGEVWGLAAGQVCAAAGDIVDANHGWSVNASHTRKLLAFAKGWIQRRLAPKRESQHVEDGRPPSSASWPEYGWYANHSPTLKSFWDETPNEHRQMMTRLWGIDPWSRPLQQWSREAPRLFRILTLLEHWRAPHASRTTKQYVAN